MGMHAPWYNTYAAHYKEAECFRLAVEEMLYDAGADMIFAGDPMMLTWFEIR